MANTALGGPIFLAGDNRSPVRHKRASGSVGQDAADSSPVPMMTKSPYAAHPPRTEIIPGQSLQRFAQRGPHKRWPLSGNTARYLAAKGHLERPLESHIRQSPLAIDTTAAEV